jgi:hypothetical protein
MSSKPRSIIAHRFYNVAVCILRYRLKLEGAGRIALQQFKRIHGSIITSSSINIALAHSSKTAGLLYEPLEHSRQSESEMRRLDKGYMQ